MSKKAARSAKPQTPKLPKGEAEQVRIRREVGHDFALRDDEFGRKRLATGTSEARRVYEVSNDGHTSTGGIVRVRSIDPLLGITSLSHQQREAGLRYREDFRASQQAGIKPMRWSERVDGDGISGGIADSVLNAGRSHAAATRALGHWEVVGVVRKIVCLEQSVRGVAGEMSEGRDVAAKLLRIGLDLLAMHYGMMMRK
ncbi:DUF6456 domain-containing protein [Mesorhizobium sp. BR1-1-9]|uniref:DUF6456 domain-containing protein n=1 Tax=unclassified Mesorhizobium TaxID=325217 RepID=UPI001CD19388|nr:MULTISPECIES: DUF6456 domain-containing protein [unclassified Mesorhizobium]MBZ9871451.1 DUF6456 domain-containing protein [Mesorhizobium sp. BR1-1-9]MBZ9943335.1 DUF6456 domain-containing protein [Mesorhizobium sp. BR1-1-13]